VKTDYFELTLGRRKKISILDPLWLLICKRYLKLKRFFRNKKYNILIKSLSTSVLFADIRH